jgi:hypothetical protein
VGDGKRIIDFFEIWEALRNLRMELKRSHTFNLMIKRTYGQNSALNCMWFACFRCFNKVCMREPILCIEYKNKFISKF